MQNTITQSKWFKYIIETLTITFTVALFCGVVIGFIRGWKYASNGFSSLILDTLNISIYESLVFVFLFFFLFLALFLVLNRFIKRTKLACFIASAISCLPFFLFWGYRINQANWIQWAYIFERQAIILNLKIGLAFVLLWFLVSVGLFFWTRSRVLTPKTASTRLLGLLVGIILVFNVSIYLFYNFYSAKQNSPNVIILLVDCLRADRLSSLDYSRNTTPNIDKFAEDAVMFTQAISQSTFTKTSIASLFTSLYPYQHGIYSGAGDLRDLKSRMTTDVLDRETTLLAEVLLNQGFLTMAWLQQGQLGSYMGFSRGFIEYNERQGGIENINRKFIEWARRLGTRHKFFAYLHYLDLHDPYTPKPPYDSLYTGEAVADEGLSKVERRANRQMPLYDGLITYIDGEIGALIDDLKKTGLYDNTLIILTSDHGEAFGEHGFFTHSREPYEELIRVPLIIKFPNSQYAGKVIKNQVRLIDIMPTILDFLNVKVNSKLEGFSLLNYLNDDTKDRDSIPEYAITEIFNQRYAVDALSIRTEKFKYIHSRNKQDELYDLRSDPGEKNNIINRKPEMAKKFHKMLSPILAEKEQNKAQKVHLDERTVKELQSLGYIQ